VTDPETVRKVCLYRAALRDLSPAAEGFGAFLSRWLIRWHASEVRGRPKARRSASPKG
jgi:hypothetical protein